MAMLLAPSVGLSTIQLSNLGRRRKIIKDKLATTPTGTPVLVCGLDPIAQDHAMPTRQELDAFSTDHPIGVIALSAHTISVNTAAFEFAGVTAQTPDPPGGRFGKAADGSLDGIVHEAPAVAMVARPMLGAVGFDYVSSLSGQVAALSRPGSRQLGNCSYRTLKCRSSRP